MAAFITAAVTWAATTLTSIGAATGLVSAAAGTFSLAGAMLGGAIVGAVAGGVIAAVKGESILDGALKGGLWGAAAGGALGMGAAWAEGVNLVGGTAAVEAGEVGVLTTEQAAAKAAAGVQPAAEAGAVKEITAAPYKIAVEEGTKAAGAKAAGLTAGMSGSDKVLLAATGAGIVGDLLAEEPETKEKRILEGTGDIPIGEGFTGEFEGMVEFEALNRFVDGSFYDQSERDYLNQYRTRPGMLAANTQQPRTEGTEVQPRTPVPTTPTSNIS